MKSKVLKITGIILFIVISFCSYGQDSIHKKLNKKKVHITTSPAGLSGIHITYSGTSVPPTQLNAGSQTLGATFTPSPAGSYTVKASITDRNYLGEKSKPKSSSILKYLPYVGIAVSILLAVFFFIRKRDEEITLPENYYNENDN